MKWTWPMQSRKDIKPVKIIEGAAIQQLKAYITSY